MTIRPGTYKLGPTDGTLQVRTGRQGMAQKVGHDLTLEATVLGNLSIAGQSRQISLDLTIEPNGDSAHLRGRVPLVQSNFGVKPFTAMMGALKVKDEVEVDLDVRLASE